MEGRGRRKGLRWCGFVLFLVRSCRIFYFHLRYCSFKTLSGLRLLQPLGRGFRWKSVCGDGTLRNGGHPVVLQTRDKWFVLQRIRVYYISLQFNSLVCNYGLFQLILNVIKRFGQWCVDLWNVSLYSLVFSFLWFNAQEWQVMLSRSQLKAKRTFGFDIREKIRCGLRFFDVFLCGFAVFGPLSRPPFFNWRLISKLVQIVVMTGKYHKKMKIRI